LGEGIIPSNTLAYLGDIAVKEKLIDETNHLRCRKVHSYAQSL